MAAVQPPAHIQALTESSDVFRRLARVHRASAGVRLPGDLAVSQNGTPNMSVNVAAGEAVIDGTQATTTQGSYEVLNDAAVNLAVAASDPTNPRIDIVVAQVEDAQYAGAANDWKLAVVTGTPAPSPSPPAAPANSQILGQVAVAANATSIVNANITDKRTFVWQTIQPGATGFHVRNSANSQDNMALDDFGHLSLAGALSVPTAIGVTYPPSSFGTVRVKADEQNPTSGAAVTINLPSGFRVATINWTLRTNSANAADILQAQFNSDIGNNYDYVIAGYSSTANDTPAAATGVAFIRAGAAAGGTTAAGIFNKGVIEILDYTEAVSRKQVGSHCFRNDAGLFGQDVTNGSWHPATAVAITSVTLTLAAGAYVTGCRFLTYVDP